jgi:thiol-disulfide isomerase/thioredoxin
VKLKENRRMKVSPVKLGLIALPLIGGAAFVYVIFSALVSSERGALDSYARGDMARFQTVSEPPGQPRHTLVTADGTETSLEQMRGRILLVNFWATWCAPCVIEMPYLDTLQAEYGSDDFEVVTVSMDRSIEDAREFFERTGLEHLALYHDPSMSSAMAAGARGLPTTILYGRDGREIGRLAGEADWAGEDAFRLIEAALERY